MQQNKRCYHDNTNFDMASLLTDPLFEISGRAPPPIKNFYHFSLTKSGVSIDIFDECHDFM